MDLNKLMTSDFISGHTPDELRDFLLEFRKNYRLLHNDNRQYQRHLESKESIIKILEENNEKLKKRNDILADRLGKVYKKLSWGERISGKINRD